MKYTSAKIIVCNEENDLFSLVCNQILKCEKGVKP